MLVFEERGKLEYPEKNLSERNREPTNSAHLWRRVWESNPGHIGGRQVLYHCANPAPPKMFVKQTMFHYGVLNTCKLLFMHPTPKYCLIIKWWQHTVIHVCDFSWVWWTQIVLCLRLTDRNCHILSSCQFLTFSNSILFWPQGILLSC